MNGSQNETTVGTMGGTMATEGSGSTAALDEPQRRWVERLTALSREASAGLDPGAAPFFAHLCVQSRGRARDYLLGYRTESLRDATMIHWQTAPVAGVYFANPVGSEYELEIDGRTLEGSVLARHLLSFVGGELVRIQGEDYVLSREPNAPWRAERIAPDGLLPARSPEARARAASPVDVVLDPVQRAAVERPEGDAQLVLGEAGAGKTTVALHRLAYLVHARRRRGDAPMRALVLVPTEGLRRLTESLLDRLGASDVNVALYDRWAAGQARRAFKHVPLRESQDAAPGVLRLKRHRALRVALESFARAGRKRNTDREDLLNLFGDRPLMDQVMESSNGEVVASDVASVILHTRLQFTETTEEEYADVVDATRLETVDGRSIDAGTPMQDAGTIDVEDYAVLFELDRLRARARGAADAPVPYRYECIVVDEGQEFAPLELALAGRSLEPGGTLVVAGDAGQQVDATACFRDWDTSMLDLGVRDPVRTVLQTSYRCPPEVTALARFVLDPTDSRGRALASLASKSGTLPVSAVRAENDCHLLARLSDALRELLATDSRASVAVVARTPDAARRFGALLARAHDIRLALDGDFRFGPGVNVTCVQEVKGLEFDYIVVPDATASTYPDGPESRRALYVALTRAVHHVTLAGVGTPTHLIGMEDGLQLAGCGRVESPCRPLNSSSTPSA